MKPSPQQTPEEVRRLQRCINDLISILALPAMWTGCDPQQIAGTLLDSLLGMLRLDLVYLRLMDSGRGRPIEMFRVRHEFSPASSEKVCEIIRASLDENVPPNVTVQRRFAEHHYSLLPLQVGLQGELGWLVACSQRLDFPEPTERLVLSVAANQAVIGLQEARLLNDQKRLASELDRQVAQRTAELASSNEELKKEIVERKKIEERLLDSEALLTKALEEIKKSEGKLRQVIDTIPTLAWCNLPDGPNEFLNKGWHEYTGLSPQESNGWGWQVAFHPDDLPPLLETWRRLLISGEPGEMEARLRRRDGVFRWFLIRVQPLHDARGQIVRWYGTSTDIDDRKQAEERLRRSEAFLAEGQELSRIGNFLWLIPNNEITWSEQMYRIFGFEQGTPVTFDLIASRVHPEDIPMVLDMIEKAQKAVANFEYEHRLVMADGSVKYLHLIAHGSHDYEGRLEYIGAVQDVTQRRSAEEALAKARMELAQVNRETSLGVLTASIAHEVNQPLSGIITNASTCLRMLGAEPPNIEGARETARRTIRDGNRASDVITRLRALFSRKDAPIDSVNLNDAAREVLALSAAELQGNGVVVRLELDDEIPTVRGDRVQLQQVILNLVRNASDAMTGTDDRAKLLLIKTSRSDADSVCVEVQDTGVGFDSQAAERLFEAFYTTKSQGMGIGLSVSRSIIERHHGRIWASPNPHGPGATFAFVIPQQEESEAAA